MERVGGQSVEALDRNLRESPQQEPLIRVSYTFLEFATGAA